MESIDQKLLDEGIILLDNTIDSETVSQFHKQLVYVNGICPENEYINIHVNSHGGNLSSCFGIINLMKGSASKIKTVCLSTACSAAFMILIAGDKRIITENTTLMMHQYTGGKNGKYFELANNRKIEDWWHETIKRHVLEHSNLDPIQVDKLVLNEKDNYFLPKEALQFGFVDEVLG